MSPTDGSTNSCPWIDIPTAPPDAILGLNTQFLADPDPNKVNLGVGAYRTAEGEPYVLPVVRRMEQRVANDPNTNHEYIPQDGLSEFSAASAKLILGNDSPAIAEGRVVTVQALSGTGALRVGMVFIRKFVAEDTLVYLPSPTWSNHKNIVPESGLPRAKEYRYFDRKTGGVDIEGMLADLAEVPARSVILLHGCAHNPTGADPSHDDWRRILEVVQRKQLIPFFDNAYQGFASGSLATDAYSVRLFVAAGIDVLVGQSYAKNMGLYGERVGALSVVSSATGKVEAIRSQLKGIIRAMYSSPPLHGARIAAMILNDPEAFAEWESELVNMSNRIALMRSMLKAELERIETPGTWNHITSQIGMFSFTGISAKQVEYIREKYHIYMTLNGRISMAGLTEKNVAYVAKAMRDAIVSVK